MYTELIPASDCSSGCWKAVAVIFQGTLERSGGDHNAFVKMQWANGSYITSGPNGPFWTAYWGSDWDQEDDEADDIPVKGADDWGDFPLFASDPDWEPYTCHCPGPYGAFAGSDRTKSDIIWGMGLLTLFSHPSLLFFPVSHSHSNTRLSATLRNASAPARQLAHYLALC